MEAAASCAAVAAMPCSKVACWDSKIRPLAAECAALKALNLTTCATLASLGPAAILQATVARGAKLRGTS